MQREALDETFAAIDLDGDGYISVAELKAYCKQFERVNIDKAEALRLMKHLDKDSDGRLNGAELLAANLGVLLARARDKCGMYDREWTLTAK